jgi:hypothetical protein
VLPCNQQRYMSAATSGWPRSGLSHLTWSETYHALDHLLSGVVGIVSTSGFHVKKKVR